MIAEAEEIYNSDFCLELCEKSRFSRFKGEEGRILMASYLFTEKISKEWAEKTLNRKLNYKTFRDFPGYMEFFKS